MCVTPKTVKDANNVYHTVPCSKCPVCAARRASAWSFRLMQEESVSLSAYFITLTYDTDSVPITKKKRMALCPRHLQLFFKRVRRSADRAKRLSSSTEVFKPIKYYAVGEYGGRTRRPHYHAIVFNARLKDMVSESDELVLKHTQFDGKTPVSIKQWKFGHATFGQVNEASVGYTLKYISKGKSIPEYPQDDRIPEFAHMSKGLGMSYITQAIIKWHTSDVVERVYCTVPGGVKITMPRYYKDRIYNSEQRGQIAAAFEIKMAKENEKYYGGPTTDTPMEYLMNERNKVEAIKASYRKQKFKSKIDIL